MYIHIIGCTNYLGKTKAVIHKSSDRATNLCALRSSRKLATLDSSQYNGAGFAHPVGFRRPYACELDLQYEDRHNERCVRFLEG